MCLNSREVEEAFYESGSKVGCLIRLECEQGLHSLNLTSGGGSPNLDEFSGPFNLASCGFVAAPPLIAIVRICSLELREGHGGWSFAYKK